MLLGCLLLWLVSFGCAWAQQQPLDPALFVVWGPGLIANVTLPVRYFFVQLVDADGRNVTSDSYALVDFHLWVGAVVDGSERSVGQSEVLFIGEGLYVARYRPWRSLSSVEVRLTCCDGRWVNGFPRRFQSAVFEETCACSPPFSLSDWAQRIGCPSSPPSKILHDLQPFASGIDAEQVIDQFQRHVASPNSVAACRYRILDQGAAIYRHCYGQHVGFHQFSDEFLLSLARKARLPALDFVWNLGDWPLGLRDPRGRQLKLPIVSWGGSLRSSDLLVPTYEITEATLQMMNRITVDVFSVLEASAKVPWTDRVDKLFWRGRDSHAQRLKLVRMSQEWPDLIDARLTAMLFHANDSSLGQLASHSSFFDFFRNKYQINVDGTVAAYRFPLLLAGGSPVLKQNSSYVEHFYDELRAWRQYVPVRDDLSDLQERLLWLKMNTKEAVRIARAARRFVLHQLTPLPLFCYYAHLFDRLARLLKPLRPQEMMTQHFDRVEQPPRRRDCVCSSSVNVNTRDEF